MSGIAIVVVGGQSLVVGISLGAVCQVGLNLFHYHYMDVPASYFRFLPFAGLIGGSLTVVIGVLGWNYFSNNNDNRLLLALIVSGLTLGCLGITAGSFQAQIAYRNTSSVGTYLHNIYQAFT